jgi:hypothetical protein
MTDRFTASAAARCASFAGAALLTLAILAGIDRLATLDAPAPQMARSTSVHPA